MYAYVCDKVQYFLALLDFSSESDYSIKNNEGKTLVDIITKNKLDSLFTSDQYSIFITSRVKTILTDLQERKQRK